MGKFLSTFFGFLVFAGGSYVLLLVVWGSITPIGLRPNLPFLKGMYGHLHSRVQEIPDYGEVDILFLGSSRTYRGFDPRIFDRFGIRAFNLGSTSQTPIQSLVLTKQYLNDLKPQRVVIEVSPGMFSKDGVEAGLDLLSNNPIDGNAVEMVWKANNIKLYNTLIYAWFRQVMEMDEDFVEPQRVNEDLYISGGFVERDLSYNKSLTASSRHAELLPEQLKAFEELLELLRTRGVEYMLVQAPTTTARYNSISNREELEAYLQEQGQYVNFNNRLSLSDSLHFYDPNHLNQNGVEIFNLALIEWLREKGYYDQLTARESIKN